VWEKKCVCEKKEEKVGVVREKVKKKEERKKGKKKCKESVKWKKRG
jgi:hypothetical protein